MIHVAAEVDQYTTNWNGGTLTLDPNDVDDLIGYFAVKPFPKNGDFYKIDGVQNRTTFNWYDSTTIDVVNDDFIQYNADQLIWTNKGSNLNLQDEEERLKYHYYKKIITNFKGHLGTWGGSFDSRVGAVNLLAVRGWRAGRPVADVRNEWDDTIIAVWDDGTRKRCREFQSTTQPGMKDEGSQNLNDAQNQAIGINGEKYGFEGNAMMLPGQFLYQRGRHSSRLGLSQYGYFGSTTSSKHEKIQIKQNTNTSAVGYAKFGSNKLQSVTIVDGGSAYNNTDTAEIVFLQGANCLGSGALIEITSVDSQGKIPSGNSGISITNKGQNYYYCCAKKEDSNHDRCKFAMPVKGVPASQSVPYHPEGSFCAQLGTVELPHIDETGMYSFVNRSIGSNCSLSIELQQAGSGFSLHVVNIQDVGSGYKVGEVFQVWIDTLHSCKFQIDSVNSQGGVTAASLYVPEIYDSQWLSNVTNVFLGTSEPNIYARAYIDLSTGNPQVHDIIVRSTNPLVTWEVCDDIQLDWVDGDDDNSIQVKLVGNRGCGKAKFVRYPYVMSQQAHNKWWDNAVYDQAYLVTEGNYSLNYGIEHATIHANLHSGKGNVVSNWSHGCQVIHNNGASTSSVTADSDGMKSSSKFLILILD